MKKRTADNIGTMKIDHLKIVNCLFISRKNKGREPCKKQESQSQESIRLWLTCYKEGNILSKAIASLKKIA